MNIVVDENIPGRTVAELRKLGHSVLDLRETADKGADDATLWNMAQQRSALLITTDKGFVQLRRESHAGVLVVRLRQPNRFKIHDRIMAAISHFPEQSWPGQTVVMRDRARSVRWQSPRPNDARTDEQA